MIQNLGFIALLLLHFTCNCLGTGYGFNYSDFSSLHQLSFAGDAQVVDKTVILGLQSGYSSGAIWSSVPQPITQPFRVEFTVDFNIGPNGADGMTFVIQNQGITTLGGCGGDLGYSYESNDCESTSDIIAPFASVAIEFDIYQNAALFDPNGNHISVHTNGVEPNSASEKYSIGYTTNIPQLRGSTQQFIIDYTPGTLQIVMSPLTAPVLIVQPVELDQILESNTAYIGFTSAYGIPIPITNSTSLLSWSFMY